MRHAWTGPITYADPDAFAQIDAAALTTFGTGPGIVRAAPFAERKFLRYAPEFVDDPGNSGLFSHIGASVYVSPAAFVAAADNAALVGYRTIIADGHFFNDEIYSPERRGGYITRLSQTDPFPNEDTRLRRQADTDTFVLEQGGQHWRRFEGTTIVLCSGEPSNYGSFLFRVLPKIFALKQLGLTNLPV
ncbi:MAG TPA: hypothetical protein VHX39_19450, partial [Acetobacteraceae bacterium]|nr:hypothetical protein [Acetobacteraceae bacterium]